MFERGTGNDWPVCCMPLSYSTVAQGFLQQNIPYKDRRY